MNRASHVVRFEYELIYRLLRKGNVFDTLYFHPDIDREILKAADYSYQAYGYEANGWISNTRRKRFLQIKWRIFIHEELPF